MRLAGSFNLCEDVIFYMDDDMRFYSSTDGGEPASVSDLETWAVLINSPWSQMHEGYEICCNCKDAYTKMDEKEPVWKCTYSIIGYDGLTAEVIGYGNTEDKALCECKQLFTFLQKQYNKDGEAI